MSERNRKNNARRKAARKYQREHGVSYTEALRAVSDPAAPKIHPWYLVAGYEDDGEPVMLSMDGVGGPNVLWISGPTGSVKFLELFVLAAQYCRMGARVVACAHRPDEPAAYWSFYRDELNRFEYTTTPEQLAAVVDELAASAPAAGADPVPAVLVVDDFAISGTPEAINFERLAGLNVVVLMGMQPDLFTRAEELWNVSAASRIEVDSLPAHLGRIPGAGGQYKEYNRLFTAGRSGESAMVLLQLAADGVGVVSDEMGVVRAYRQAGVAVPPPGDFAAIEDSWPGDIEVGPHSRALGATAAQKKQAFRDSMSITFLDATRRRHSKDQDAD